MTITELIEGLPAKITEALKGLFATADQKVAAAEEKAKTAIANELKAQADLADAKETISTIEAEKTALGLKSIALGAEKTALNLRVTTLEAGAKTAGAKAAELLAGQGIPTGDLPAGGAGAQSDEVKAKEASAHYHKLLEEGKSLEAGRYYEKNKALFN